MRYILVIPLLFLTTWASNAIAAKATKKLDQHGHIIQQSDATGQKSIHTYARNGSKIKSENSSGQRVFFDKSTLSTGNAAISAKQGAK